MRNTWIANNRWTRKPLLTRITGRAWIRNKPWVTRYRWTASRKPWMTPGRWLAAAGIGTLGAGLMYYFDPERGRRRRSLLSDQAVHAGHKLQSGAGKTGRDLRNRTKGTLASVRGLFRSRKTEDEVLTERVRAHLGRAVSHPGSIEVDTQQGRVSLSGPVLAHEVEQLILHVRSVHGVKEIENRLDAYDEAGQIPGLQGAGTPRAGERGAFRQTQ
jgi:hypothetical protein